MEAVFFLYKITYNIFFFYTKLITIINLFEIIKITYNLIWKQYFFYFYNALFRESFKAFYIAYHIIFYLFINFIRSVAT